MEDSPLFGFIPGVRVFLAMQTLKIGSAEFETRLLGKVMF
jgi:hypothetical protein